MYCSHCGAENEDARAVCIRCNEKLVAVHVPSRDRRTAVTALVLGLAVLICLAALIFGYVSYNQATRRHPPPEPAPAALRTLAVAMESYYADFDTYTKDWVSLSDYLSREELRSDYPGVRIDIVRADMECWKGTARRGDTGLLYTYNSCEGGLRAPERPD